MYIRRLNTRWDSIMIEADLYTRAITTLYTIEVEFQSYESPVQFLMNAESLL